jgi:hypothetical protein
MMWLLVCACELEGPEGNQTRGKLQMMFKQVLSSWFSPLPFLIIQH